MNYFQLIPLEQRESFWVFHEICFDGKLRLKERYSDLRCELCHKINERAALDRGGLIIDVPIGDDYLVADDGLVLLSSRALERLDACRISGFTRLPLRGNLGYSIAWPEVLVPTDRNTMGIQVHGICEACGRMLETSFLPRLSSLTLPESQLALFASEVWSESRQGKVTWFTASEEATNRIQMSGITGLDYKLLKF